MLARFSANSVAPRASWMKPASIPRGWSCGVKAAQRDVLYGAVGSVSGRRVLFARLAKLC